MLARSCLVVHIFVGQLHPRFTKCEGEVMTYLLRIMLVVVTVMSAHSPAVVHAGVNGDDANDAYVGTGGLLLPTSFTGGATRAKAVSSCLGCAWKYSVYCAQGNVDVCNHAVATCPVGQMRYRVWFGRTFTAVSVIGSVCWGTGSPPTRRSIEKRVNDIAVRYVPVLKLVLQPADGTITSIPVIARTGQPTTFTPPAMVIAGRRVSVTATAQWHWVWGDGQTEWKAVPGAAYPSNQVTHKYRSVGTYLVTVETVWAANYTVAGLGTYPVTGEVVTQSASVVMPVRTAQTALTPWE